MFLERQNAITDSERLLGAHQHFCIVHELGFDIGPGQRTLAGTAVDGNVVSQFVSGRRRDHHAARVIGWKTGVGVCRALHLARQREHARVGEQVLPQFRQSEAATQQTGGNHERRTELCLVGGGWSEFGCLWLGNDRQAFLRQENADPIDVLCFQSVSACELDGRLGTRMKKVTDRIRLE